MKKNGLLKELIDMLHYGREDKVITEIVDSLELIVTNEESQKDYFKSFGSISAMENCNIFIEKDSPLHRIYLMLTMSAIMGDDKIFHDSIEELRLIVNKIKKLLTIDFDLAKHSLYELYSAA